MSVNKQPYMVVLRQDGRVVMAAGGCYHVQLTVTITNNGEASGAVGEIRVGSNPTLVRLHILLTLCDSFLAYQYEGRHDMQ